ncbi:hypothetical protein AB0B89_30940 [Sphaerisporangium sp. NPDC049002]|uniref:hypothetical protein n=1 Tax=Sphaerisporangium sp. NPDC049002 TaxID=3155392 RepID=UPI0033E766AA
MGSLVNLLTAAGGASTILYMLLVFTFGMVATFSKKKHRREMAWKVFSALMRRRPEPPTLPPSVKDGPQK